MRDRGDEFDLDESDDLDEDEGDDRRHDALPALPRHDLRRLRALPALRRIPLPRGRTPRQPPWWVVAGVGVCLVIVFRWIIKLH